MTTAVPAEDTRTRLLGTALKLFAEHGVEGTSLQMIADALGVTKAAVYYHFKTKAEITEAVAAPAIRELDALVSEAATQRRRGAQVDHLLDGFVDLVVRHRVLVALFSSDPGINRAIENSTRGMEGFKNALIDILAGPDPDISSRVSALVTLTGLAMTGGSPDIAHLDDESLRRELVDVGRRLLGRPRRHWD
ncbi:TetR/AcrR family transcriptional regulator [Amycolatopsis sp. FDAARGOS 1241]|uniref:TetR/AcrR family transcriptional regulator n=1 Tax=Amycolatopsis sp. FDAARGOS 1241 TaxID=2778070 RepID=UPI001951D09C|nr:TetR/AcrR family transcriptional regulator [Amycolatopsis sp. FDAARGOS 1241]QRP44174.1 TetR family transcriptional regulator [Amycolatopsis sp. FDAARGOS 1241]